jgi:hypothetical protein
LQFDERDLTMKRFTQAALLTLVLLVLAWHALGELPPKPTISLHPAFPQAQTPAPQREAATEMRQYKYKLTTPLPSLVERGAIQPGLNSYAAFFCMFQSSDGKVHFIAPFDNDGISWHALYVNLSDAAAFMITGGEGSYCARYCYDPARNIMHLGLGRNGYWYTFDVATRKLSLLTNKLPWPINKIIMGSDGMLWVTGTETGGPFASYDPATGVFKTDWPTPHPDAQYLESFGADANYIYCGCRGKNDAIGRFLVVIDRANPHHIMTFNHGQGDVSANVAPGARDGKYYYFRREGAKNNYRQSHYALPPVNGRLTEVFINPNMDEYQKSHCVFEPAGNDHTWQNRYHWQVNLDKCLPLEGTQEYSELKFRHPVGLGPWTTVSAPYKGPWGENGDMSIVGLSPTKVVSINDYVVVYDYVKNIRSVKGPTYISPYGSMRYDPTGEIYILGYAKSTLRYDPNKPWTLVASNVKPYSLKDPKRPNPYQISLVDSGHFHFAADYDAAGLVWIASNSVRTGSDYGVLVWYNPADGTSGTVPALQALLQPGATKLRALVATNHRTKICVSGADNKIYVIDAATRTLEHTWTLKPDRFDAIIAVADDNLLVVQASIDDATGNVSRVTKLRVSTGDILFDQPIGVAGWAFGAQTSTSKQRYAWRLVKGPDNFGWMFVGDHLYRIDPTTGVFSKICDMPYGQLVFNGADLGIYACNAKERRNHFLYFPNILTRISH